MLYDNYKKVTFRKSKREEIYLKESMKISIGVGNENVRTSISRDEAEKIFLIYGEYCRKK